MAGQIVELHAEDNAFVHKGDLLYVIDKANYKVKVELAQADVASWAYHGTAVFKSKGAITNLRAIAALFPESIHLVVLKDSPINSLRDLKGKRVGLGEKESGTLADARIVLEAAGLTERDLKPDYSRLGDATAGLSAKTLDAFFLAWRDLVHSAASCSGRPESLAAAY